MAGRAERGDDPRVGTTVASRYFLHRLLGRGGMGDVFAATRLADERPVALKVLRAGPDAERLARFEREAALTARLRHPGCVEVFESGWDPGAGAFLAMELVRGRDLHEVLRDEGRLAPARAARIADGVLSVLVAAHGAGVLHRDLKPENVMLDQAGGAERVKVLDFGIATFLDPAPGERALTTDGVTHGTPAYMSPEQIRGEPLDARSDLYAVGALLFELLAGTPAFEGPTPMAVAARQLTDDAPPLASRRPEVGPALARLVAQALDRDPARRPASAAVLREALREAVPGFDDAASGPQRSPPATEGFPALPAVEPRRGRWRVAVGIGVIAGAIAAIVVSTQDSSSSSSTPSTSTPTSTPTATSTSTPTSTSTRTSTPTPTPTPTSTPTPTRAPTATAHPAPAPSPRPPRAGARRAPAAPVPPAPDPSRAIRVVRGELNAVPTPAVESGDGVLVLQASPWAIVSVAGVPLGETPREVRIAAGTYDVRAVHPDLGERVAPVTVRAGERALWSVSFEH